MTITISRDDELNLYAVTAADGVNEIDLECLTKTELDKLTVVELYKLLELEI